LFVCFFCLFVCLVWWCLMPLSTIFSYIFVVSFIYLFVWFVCLFYGV
jgi:hypothetical protein